jgi:hypothetical protein
MIALARKSMLRFVPAFGLLLVTAGCAAGGGASRAPGPTAVVAPPSAPAPSLPMPDSGWQRIAVPSLALSVELPDAGAWRRAGGRDWVRLVYRDGEASLELRRFRAEPAVRALDCASRAGLSWEEDGEGLVERRMFEVDDGLRTELAATVGSASADGTLSGRLEAASAGFRVCIALRVELRVKGEGRESELARRLSLFSDRVVPSLALRGIEDRVRGEGVLDPSGT